MGNAKSINVAKAVVDIYSKVAAETVQSSNISSNNTQIVSVSNTGGDVVISGNTITQKANINMTSLMDSISNIDSQQKIGLQLDQLAKSLVSGLNFFTFDDAKNTAETLVKSQTEINNAIKQTCALSSNNVQSITVKSTKGNVSITNNVLSQMTDIFDKCALKSVLGVRAVEDIQSRIDQTAESKLEGLNLMWVILAVLAFILVPILVAGRVASNSLKYIFPLLAVAGAIIFSLYFVLGKTYMKSYNFTKPFNCDKAKKDGSVSATTSVKQAVDACLKTSSCRVMDARVTENGLVAKLTPVISFYSSGESCPLDFYTQPIGQLISTDVTAIKTTDRYQWMLYVSLAMMVGGLLGFLIQNRRGADSSNSSTGFTGESPIIMTETSV